MIRRFSLYGFLKNQRYFEPFLVLVFLEKGLSFFQIGLLIGFREVCITLSEVPSGAWADLYGRRRAMLVSFGAYILSFALLAVAREIPLLFLAMGFYALGDAFRSGTHKAMIFQWLALKDRLDERTEFYGLTRSWSRIGSAVAVIVAPILVFGFNQYSVVFWAAILPYLANMVNVATYPQELDHSATSKDRASTSMWDFFRESLLRSFSLRPLRHILLESSFYEGLYRAVKDYLQPVLHGLALALPFFLALDDRKRTAFLVGGVYVLLHLAEAVSARKAHVLQARAGSDFEVSRWLWWAYLCIFMLLTPAFAFGWDGLAIACFVCLAVTQNFWRPVLIGRISFFGPREQTATLLSIESQTRALVAMVIAPCLGWTVDRFGFTPIGLLGLFITLVFLIGFYRQPAAHPS